MYEPKFTPKRMAIFYLSSFVRFRVNPSVTVEKLELTECHSDLAFGGGRISM
jgi:hypothetical protein